MHFPPIFSERQWSYIRLAWHLMWPGWLVGMVLFALGGLTNRQAAFIMLAMLTVSRVLRLWALSRGHMELLPSNSTTSKLWLASRVTLMECLAFGGAWLGWRLLQSPQFDPDSMVLQSLLIPWVSLFFVVSSLEHQERNAASL